MNYLKEDVNYIYGQCNMCKKEFSVPVAETKKIVGGYKLLNTIKCSGCGGKHVDIIDYKRKMKHANKTQTRVSFEDEKKAYEMKSRNKCPKCGSVNFTPMKKGFGLGKAAAGVAVAGLIGFAGGLIGSNKIIFVCNECGNKWSK
jgi:DNA-directed RNA polymerase subunit M/transcription elongation factor TFIIS